MKRIQGPGRKEFVSKSDRIRLMGCERMNKEALVTGRIEWKWIDNGESD